MAYKSEMIKKGELKVGRVYKKELLDFYAEDYNCMLVIPNHPANVFTSDDESDYEVKSIIDSCCLIKKEGDSMRYSHVNSLIIIEKVD